MTREQAQYVISELTWKAVGAPTLESTKHLIAYAGIPIETLGKANVKEC